MLYPPISLCAPWLWGVAVPFTSSPSSAHRPVFAQLLHCSASAAWGREGSRSGESPDCKGCFIVISLMSSSSPLKIQRCDAFSVKLMGIWKVPGELGDMGGVGSGDKPKPSQLISSRNLYGKEQKAEGPELFSGVSFCQLSFCQLLSEMLMFANTHFIPCRSASTNDFLRQRSRLVVFLASAWSSVSVCPGRL